MFKIDAPSAWVSNKQPFLKSVEEVADADLLGFENSRPKSVVVRDPLLYLPADEFAARSSLLHVGGGARLSDENPPPAAADTSSGQARFIADDIFLKTWSTHNVVTSRAHALHHSISIFRFSH